MVYMHQIWNKVMYYCTYQIESAMHKIRQSLHLAYNICLLQQDGVRSHTCEKISQLQLS